ncbi:hypothetical protein VCRA2121O157_30051 [Vibrio crassostreae]|nr:hypothetical protein VCRA2119O382_130029 [Vibrio crassostreae]CAK1765653.1 hypothetical protein VCRA2117O380_130115 [Vibrio crassostreae]CAK1796873.1 hypothetical protein VCRA2119O381_1560003 [Vibrio crassostreae]CAK2061486.1 hypothetical protein VCRA2113O351_30117 [Vibrio crassostreae]CAK2109937.1 hypothetical protein VCRA2113O358_40115 [Vibrio crassostreae]
MCIQSRLIKLNIEFITFEGRVKWEQFSEAKPRSALSFSG